MSLHHQDWLKILGGLALAATGAGAAGVGPLAGVLSGASAAGGAGAGAGAATAGAGAAGHGFASLIAPALVGSGVGSVGSGLMGTPQETMTTPSGVPQMDAPTDPFEILKQIQAMKSGGFGG